MKESIETLAELLAIMNPEIHMNLKTAVELGRWANGDRLSPGQLENCLQAIIAYEKTYLPETERVGYIDTSALKKSHCDDPDHNHNADKTQNMKWVQ